MKTIFKYIIILTSLNSFGQSNIMLEPDYACEKCLTEKTIPAADTIECYPIATTMWLKIIKHCYDSLYVALDAEKRRKLTGDQLRWEHYKSVEFDSTTKISSEKERPIHQRRMAAVTETKIVKGRAVELLNYIQKLKQK